MNRAAAGTVLCSTALGIALAATACAHAADDGAAEFVVDWFTVDAGGGRSSGAGYTLDGTLGQADADPLHPATSGAFALDGGYWALSPEPRVDSLFADGFESP